MLDKGFPIHGPAFWRAWMTRVKQLHDRQSIDDYGDLLMNDDQAVGVLIKIHHRSPKTQQSIINLSSWYIEPEFRWFAPRMLMKAISSKGITYTDYSPSPEVYHVNERLGFKTIATSNLVFPLPWTALRPARRATIRTVVDLSPADVSAELLDFMQQHQSSNNAVFFIDDGHQLQPAIFQLRKRRGIPCAELIYAEDKSLLQTHCGQIARHLLRQRVLLMTMPTLSDQAVPGSFRLKTFLPQQVKGDWTENMVDQTFSETILLPYHA